MPSIDLYHNSYVETAFDYASISAGQTYTGNIIDLAGYESNLFVISAHNISTAEGYWIMQEGDASDLSDAATATQTFGSVTFDDDDADHTSYRVAYKGGKRYVRLAFVGAGTAQGQYASAVAVLTRPAQGPVAAQGS